jgi:hypothetical protein
MRAGSDVYRAYGESIIGSYLQLRIRFQCFSVVALWPAFGGHTINSGFSEHKSFEKAEK